MLTRFVTVLSFQLNYVKLYKRSIELICSRNNRSFKEKRISTLDFWWVFFLNDLKNMIKSFLFQIKDKIKQDLFFMNKLSINWLFMSKREVILLLVSKWETELLFASELRTELLLVSKLKTELLLSSEWEIKLLLASKLKTVRIVSIWVNQRKSELNNAWSLKITITEY